MVDERANTHTHEYRLGEAFFGSQDPPENALHERRKIEPWLSALFQVEHLSVLIGNGLTAAVGHMAGAQVPSMTKTTFSVFQQEIDDAAERSAAATGRGDANIEDQFSAALQLLEGLRILGHAKADELEGSIKEQIAAFATTILQGEEALSKAFETDQGREALAYLSRFVLTFANRPPTRQRLSLFTTNYDRVIEYGADRVGLHLIDRFVGIVEARMRTPRLNIDIHYDPPGLRGEPRYLEGVIRYTKLHGSIDWRDDDGGVVRARVPFGDPSAAIDDLSLLIYPNASKDRTLFSHPYSELFRDFSSALVRPQAALVTYGYSFGDQHINAVIQDMLSVPSTHLVIIAYDDVGGRIKRFCEGLGDSTRISTILGPHFADLRTLCDHYLPRPAVETFYQEVETLRRRRGTSTWTERQDAADTNDE